MGPNDDGADDQPIADMLRTIEPARREVGDGEAPADGAARVPSAPPAVTPPVSKGTKRKVGSSGYRGVAFHQVSGKYRARITSSTGDGRQRALGYFPTKEEAARAWDDAARGLGWAEECMNFPVAAAVREAFPMAPATRDPNPRLDPPIDPPTAHSPHAHVSPNPPAFRDHDPGPVHARRGQTEQTARGRVSARNDGELPNGGFFRHPRTGGDLTMHEDRHQAGGGGRFPPGHHHAFAAQSVVASSAPDAGADAGDTAGSTHTQPLMPGALPPDRRARSGNGTGCKGVRRKGNGMYEARIKLRDRPSRSCLGRFKSALEAMRAYDDAARLAGYCVNECAKVGDLLDSHAYQAVGVATPAIAKGVKTVTKKEAIELTSRENAGPDPGPNPGPNPGPGGGGGGGGGGGTDAAASAPNAASDAAENEASGSVFKKETAATAATAARLGASPPAPLTKAEIASASATEPLYAGFILDKPGIHRFLGVFATAEAAHKTVKTTVPDWKRKNELKQKLLTGDARGGGGAGAAAGGAGGGTQRAGAGAGAGAGVSAGERGQTLGGGGGGGEGATLEASLADDVANA